MEELENLVLDLQTENSELASERNKVEEYIEILRNTINENTTKLSVQENN